MLITLEINEGINVPPSDGEKAFTPLLQCPECKWTTHWMDADQGWPCPECGTILPPRRDIDGIVQIVGKFDYDSKKWMIRQPKIQADPKVDEYVGKCADCGTPHGLAFEMRSSETQSHYAKVLVCNECSHRRSDCV